MDKLCAENHNLSTIVFQEMEEVDNDMKPCPKCGRMISITIQKSGMNNIVTGIDAYSITIKEA